MNKIIKIGALVLAVPIVGVAILLATMITSDLKPSEIDARYKNENSQIITLRSGQKAHIRDEGRRDGAPIVLLHGSNASLHTWEPWVRRLGDKYRIITLDFPGHGLTGTDIKEDYSLPSYVRFVDEVVNHIGLDQFVLGGNSMGGNVSWRYTLNFPQKVLGLILVDSSGYPNNASSGPVIFRLLRFAPFRWLFQKIHSRSMAEEGVRVAYNNAPVVTGKLIQRYVELNLRQGQRRASALRFALDRRTLSPPPRGAINTPTLILWGREDKLTPVSMASKFNRDLPNSTLVIYDNVGHIPNEEIPGRSARDVLAFLEGMNWRQRR